MEQQPPASPHRLLRTGPAIVLLVLMSFAYNWYYLTGGFQADDFYFLNMMRADPAPYSHWLGFWAADDIPALTNTWWFEGGDPGVFFRPLPSLIFEGSVRVFGERAFPLHFFSLLVHGLSAGVLFLLVRRLTGRPAPALLAGILFLSCEDHTIAVGWIATMTDLVCVLLVNLSLLAQAFWLRERKPWAICASLVALALAMLCKESAVVAPLAIVLMTLAMPRGRDE
jgi:4-amino-4-deoxy-L-arabinose transferase-like glycosyltransferase